MNLLIITCASFYQLDKSVVTKLYFLKIKLIGKLNKECRFQLDQSTKTKQHHQPPGDHTQVG